MRVLRRPERSLWKGCRPAARTSDNKLPGEAEDESRGKRDTNVHEEKTRCGQPSVSCNTALGVRVGVVGSGGRLGEMVAGVFFVEIPAVRRELGQAPVRSYGGYSADD